MNKDFTTFSIGHIFNTHKLLETISEIKSASFSELQKETQLGDTELCLAICSLIKENKIYQRRELNTVVYGVR